jgi:hypothetical protein
VACAFSFCQHAVNGITTCEDADQPAIVPVTKTAPTRWSRIDRQASSTVAWAASIIGSRFLTMSDIFLIIAAYRLLEVSPVPCTVGYSDPALQLPGRRSARREFSNRGCLPIGQTAFWPTRLLYQHWALIESRSISGNSERAYGFGEFR